MYVNKTTAKVQLKCITRVHHITIIASIVTPIVCPSLCLSHACSCTHCVSIRASILYLSWVYHGFIIASVVGLLFICHGIHCMSVVVSILHLLYVYYVSIVASIVASIIVSVVGLSLCPLWICCCICCGSVIASIMGPSLCPL
jgi:hypothetical protein